MGPPGPEVYATDAMFAIGYSDLSLLAVHSVTVAELF